MLSKPLILGVMVVLFPLLTLLFGHAHAQQRQVLKLALLDTPYNAMPLNLSLLSEYEKAYLEGIETAAYAARKYNIEIVYKPFFYGEGPLDILNEIPKIQDWRADLVIGPGFSDQFLLLKNYLPNIMVLSSYASDKTLAYLPKNFYSIFLPDPQITALLADYIHHRFRQKNLYIIAQTDCKQCVDVAESVTASYKKISPTTAVVEKKLILDNIDDIDSQKLMADHKNDVMLIFTKTYYEYNQFIKHIVQAFPNNKFIFFSDQDNWGSESKKNSNNTASLPYESYRIGPILADASSMEFQTFAHDYHALYHTAPAEAVSYMTYTTVMSAINALIKFPADKNKDMQARVLQSYLTALIKNPNWYRSRAYGIYQLTSKGEVLLINFSQTASPLKKED